MIKINSKNKGFTLVELLAVIAVLGLILIIAIPKVMETLNTQKKRTLELTTKSIIKAAEEKYLENSAYGINEEITCEGVSNITSADYDTCKILFDDNGNASVTIEGKGRYKGINICDGTKTNTESQTNECPKTAVVHIQELYENETTRGVNGLTKDNTRDENIRYAGSNDDVKNYVEFGNNGEVWRIIGIFNVTNSSGKTEPLVKLVREESIGNMSWDSSASTVNYGFGINQWGESKYEDGTLYEGADLMQLLNGYYLGNEGLSCIYCNDYNQGTCTNECNNSVTPINSSYKKMIEKVVWNTGAWDTTDTSIFADHWKINTVELYNGERSNINGKICSSTYENCDDQVIRTTMWEGLVALPYTTDWGYASSVDICRIDLRGNIDEEDAWEPLNAPCTRNNWMHSIEEGADGFWMLSPIASNVEADVRAFVWDGIGAFMISDINMFWNDEYMRVRPSLYLKSNIKIKDGDGSSTNPYKLSL